MDAKSPDVADNLSGLIDFSNGAARTASDRPASQYSKKQPCIYARFPPTVLSIPKNLQKIRYFCITIR